MIKLEWNVGMISELRVGGQRVSRLHRELDRWHGEHSPGERVISLRMLKAYCYESVLDENDPKVQLFLKTWLASGYTLTRIPQQE